MSNASKTPEENPRTRPPKEKTDIRKIREGSQSLEDGPRVQITFLYGVFGGVEGLDSEEATQELRKLLMGRLNLVISETGGKFDDLGRGRWSATLGAAQPTEEDPLMAVTIGLKLLRLAALSKKSPPLRMVAVTGRMSQRSLNLTAEIDATTGKISNEHELLRVSQNIIRECEPGMLCADGLTYQMIRDTHFCRRLTDLPGALANIPIYEVHSAGGSTNVTYDAPLCGREREMERLKKVYTRISKGDGPLFFTITGGLGIGKSRLARAFIGKIEGTGAVFRNPRERRRIDRWRRTPYSYFGEILRAFFEIFENEEMQVSREKLQRGIEQAILPEDQGEWSTKSARDLGHLCQVYYPEEPGQEEEDPAHQESRAFAALSLFLELASRNKPIVFVLEDLYSADASSIRLLKHLTEYLDPARILFLCVSRIDLLADLEEEANFSLPGEKLTLEPLSTEAARSMIVQLLPENLEFPESLCERILLIADGNPFFLRESLRDLAEQGLFEALQQGDIEEIEIPQNIEGILQARISRLTPQERDILQKAAVFGKSFWRGGVEMLFRQEGVLKPGWRLQEGGFTDRDDDLEQILATLVHKGVLQYQSNSDFEGEAQYNFMPSLMYEIAYNEIPAQLLPAYHLLVGQWLALMAFRRNSDINIEIAHHLDLGKAHSQAARYHIEIGSRSLKVYATHRAITHLEKGLKHLEPHLLELRKKGTRQLIEAYILNGQYQEAIERCNELLELSWVMGLRIEAAEVYTRMGWVYYLMRDFDNALNTMKNGHALHQEMMHQRGIATVLGTLGQVYMAMGDYQRARLFFQEALEIRSDLGHRGDLAWAHNNMGNLLLEQGNLAASQKHHEEALEIRKSIGNPHLIIRSMNNLSLIHVIQGNYDAALADLLVSSNLAQKVGEKLGMAIVMVNIGEIYLLRGDLSLADKYIQQAMQNAQKIGDPWIQAECHRLRGELLLEEGDRFGALECCGKAYRLITEHGIRSALAQIYRLMGEIYTTLTTEEIEARNKDNEEREGLPPFLFGNAISCYEESIALAHRHGNLREESKSRMMMGIHEINRGKLARGRYQLERAQAAFEQLGMKHLQEEVAEMLEEVDNFQAASSQEALSQVPLRPPRSKMANVDKTMVFRLNFEEEEMGPLPDSADLQEFLTPTEELDEDTVAGTLDELTHNAQAEQRETDLQPAPQEHKTIPAEMPPQEHKTIPAEMPPEQPPQKEPNITLGTNLPEVHTMAVKSPVYSISGQTSSQDPLPEVHTLATQRAISKHQSSGSKEALDSAPPATAEPPTREVPAPKRTKQEAPLPTEQTNSTTLEPKLPSVESQTAASASPEETEATKADSTADLSALQEDHASMIEGDDLHLETIDVVDINAASKVPQTAPRKPALLSSPAPSSGTPAPLPAESGTQTVAVRAPKRQNTLPPPEAPINNEAPTQERKAPQRSKSLPATPPKSATAGLSSSGLPSEMDFLNMPMPVKKPSVYDSQVIIAQVAENDDVSREWFEAGRSDRQDQFWKEHSQELEEVREEVELEKLQEEIDNLKEK